MYMSLLPFPLSTLFHSSVPDILASPLKLGPTCLARVYRDEALAFHPVLAMEVCQVNPSHLEDFDPPEIPEKVGPPLRDSDRMQSPDQVKEKSDVESHRSELRSESSSVFAKGQQDEKMASAAHPQEQLESTRSPRPPQAAMRQAGSSVEITRGGVDDDEDEDEDEDDSNARGSIVSNGGGGGPASPSRLQSLTKTCRIVITHSWINVLLVFVPAGIIVKVIPGVNGVVVFMMNCVAVIPLAGLLAFATESIAADLGDALGALINVTFGNVVELIIL